MSFVSCVDVRASLCRSLDAIRELCCLADAAVPEDASGVFSPALKNLNHVTERESAVDVHAVLLDSVCVVEQTAAASLSSWTVEKTDMVCKRSESCATVECLTINLAEVCEQAYGQMALQSEHHDT